MFQFRVSPQRLLLSVVSAYILPILGRNVHGGHFLSLERSLSLTFEYILSVFSEFGWPSEVSVAFSASVL